MKEPISIRQHRIGNILNYKGRPCYVSFLSLDIDDEYEDQIGVVELGKTTYEISGWNREKKIYDHLEPVPLTEDWLIKMGFIADTTVWNVWRKDEVALIKKGIFVDVAFFDFLFNDDHKNGTASAVSLMFVHQLQNLYYALKKEELTIPENV